MYRAPYDANNDVYYINTSYRDVGTLMIVVALSFCICFSVFCFSSSDCVVVVADGENQPEPW